MNPETTQERSLGDEELLYRGVREENIVGGRLNPRTFGRRPDVPPYPEKGVSADVAEGHQFSPTAYLEVLEQKRQHTYKKRLSRNPKAKAPSPFVRVLSLYVGQVRSIRLENSELLDVVPDGLPHALIVDLPVLDYLKDDHEGVRMVARAERFANLLIRVCDNVDN